MVVFQDVEEVEEWIEPMSYLELMDAVQPYSVFSEADRDHCDSLISAGKVPVEVVLEGLKYMVSDALRFRLGLKHRRHHTLAMAATKSLH